MKIVPLGIAGLAIIAGGLFAISSSCRAQDNEPEPILTRAIAATVDYGNDIVFQPTKHGTNFELLGVRGGQVLTVTVQFPVELAGRFVIGEPLDGGVISAPEQGLIIGFDGNVSFQFTTGEGFGLNRIAVHQPDDSNFVQLWIVDPNHPENDPPYLLGNY